MRTVRDLTYVGEGIIPAPLQGAALRYTLLPKADVTDIAVHHMTGWKPGPDASEEEEIRFLLGIDEFHRASRGLDGIGYQLCAMATGNVYVTARLDRYGAGVGGENNHLVSLALPGDYRDAAPAPRHQEAAAVGVGAVDEYLGRLASVRPHRYWGGTSCPGETWQQWVPGLRAAAVALKEDDIVTKEQFAALWNEALGAGLIKVGSTNLFDIIHGLQVHARHLDPAELEDQLAQFAAELDAQGITEGKIAEIVERTKRAIAEDLLD